MYWYKRNMSDYARDTASLKMIEHGAYTLMLDFYYSTGAALPSDVSEIYRIARAFERWEQNAVDRVLAKFFTLTASGYKQKRTEAELAKYEKAAEASRANGQVRSKQSGTCQVADRPHIPEARNQIKEEPKDKSSAQTAPFVLPDWIPLEEWNGFVEMRQRTRAPLTSRGKLLCVNKLKLFILDGQSAAAVLNQSVENGWKGLFPLREVGTNGRTGKSARNSGALPAEAGKQYREPTVLSNQ